MEQTRPRGSTGHVHTLSQSSIKTNPSTAVLLYNKKIQINLLLHALTYRLFRLFSCPMPLHPQVYTPAVMYRANGKKFLNPNSDYML